jgi:pyruvate dehydrogenase (quinone)
VPQTCDFVLARLRERRVHRVFAYLGRRDQRDARRVRPGRRGPGVHPARHEEMAAFMACAHAKFTGEVGCCMATSGQGAVHVLNGLYDAKNRQWGGGRTVVMLSDR